MTKVEKIEFVTHLDASGHGCRAAKIRMKLEISFIFHERAVL